ncbi:MAG: large subunit ribosomal protein L35 [Chlamydiales bacterium]|jgi:large subunit ribosomal protein L35
MPKMKSKGAIKKRFRLTKKGKLKCSRPGRGHQHAPKNGSARRRLRQKIVTDGTWAKLIKRMLGGG